MTDQNKKAIVLDKPDQIRAYQLLALEQGIKLKAETGMNIARNLPTIKALKRRWPAIFPDNLRTYRGAYEAIKAHNDKHIRKITKTKKESK